MDDKMNKMDNTEKQEMMVEAGRLESLCTQTKKIFTKARLKKAAACLLIAGIVAGGWGYYHHQQEMAQHQAVMEAKTNLIESEASQKNIALLDEAAIRSIAAETIGADETGISWRSIALTDLAQEKVKDRADQKDKKEKHAENDKNTQSAKAANAQDYMALAGPKDKDRKNAADAAERPDFLPVYNVNCSAGQVKYKLRIDAVTGNVLSSQVKG